MNPDYRSANDFKNVQDYDEIRYYTPDDDRFNAVKRAVLVCSLNAK
jgi:hypothetical protein